MSQETQCCPPLKACGPGTQADVMNRLTVVLEAISETLTEIKDLQVFANGELENANGQLAAIVANTDTGE